MTVCRNAYPFLVHLVSESLRTVCPEQSAVEGPSVVTWLRRISLKIQTLFPLGLDISIPIESFQASSPKCIVFVYMSIM